MIAANEVLMPSRMGFGSVALRPEFLSRPRFDSVIWLVRCDRVRVCAGVWRFFCVLSAACALTALVWGQTTLNDVHVTPRDVDKAKADETKADEASNQGLIPP